MGYIIRFTSINNRFMLDKKRRNILFKDAECRDKYLQNLQFPSVDCLNQNPSEFVNDLSLFMIHFDQDDIKQFEKESDLKKYLIISDTNNHCIRLIDVQSKTVTTLIGFAKTHLT